MGMAMQAVVLLVVITYAGHVTSRSYNNGLIFYDPDTKAMFLPPTVSVSRGRSLASMKYSDKGSIWSTFGKPCDCRNRVCLCCAGIRVKQFRFDQKMCVNVTYQPSKEEAQLDISLNEMPSAKYGISVRNPTPLCLPVMMGVPMAMCIQMSDIAVENNNLNMCMDFVVRLATTDLFEMHFQCMRMGLDGLQYVDKDGNPVIPAGSNKHADPVDSQEEANDGEEEEYADELEVSENEIDTSRENESAIDKKADGEADRIEAPSEEPSESESEELLEVAEQQPQPQADNIPLAMAGDNERPLPVAVVLKTKTALTTASNEFVANDQSAEAAVAAAAGQMETMPVGVETEDAANNNYGSSASVSEDTDPIEREREAVVEVATVANETAVDVMEKEAGNEENEMENEDEDGNDDDDDENDDDDDVDNGDEDKEEDEEADNGNENEYEDKDKEQDGDEQDEGTTENSDSLHVTGGNYAAGTDSDEEQSPTEALIVDTTTASALQDATVLVTTPDGSFDAGATATDASIPEAT